MLVNEKIISYVNHLCVRSHVSAPIRQHAVNANAAYMLYDQHRIVNPSANQCVECIKTTKDAYPLIAQSLLAQGWWCDELASLVARCYTEKTIQTPPSKDARQQSASAQYANDDSQIQSNLQPTRPLGMLACFCFLLLSYMLDTCKSWNSCEAFQYTEALCPNSGDAAGYALALSI